MQDQKLEKSFEVGKRFKTKTNKKDEKHTRLIGK